MRWKVLIITAFLFFPSTFVLADCDTHDPTEDDHGSVDAHGSIQETNEESHSSGDTHGSTHETSEEGSHGDSEETIVETPPNYNILSVFGAVNLSFLVFGLWNKKVRKKVDLNVDGRKKT